MTNPTDKNKNTNGDTVLDTKPKIKDQLKKPRMFKVIFLNDDFTSMEFVIDVLKRHFRHDEQSAMAIMLEVHSVGKGVAGIYTWDIAETKALLVMDEAKEKGHPLKLVLEPVEQ